MGNKTPLWLGIDTSNYTTSAALADESGKILVNAKLLLPVKEGERGLRQSDAVFFHVKQLPLVMEPIGEKIAALNGEIAAVGCSAAPRDQEGSYMPCFLAGMAAAEAVARSVNAPLYRFSHQAGHIMAAVYSADAADCLRGDFISFHVSGGTTDILYVRNNEEGTPFTITKIGGTLDINAGQLIDRVGVRMGFPFPCGRYLEAEAIKFTGKPEKMKIAREGLSFNLSGAENKAIQIFDKTKDPEQTSAFVITLIGDLLGELCRELNRRYPGVPILFAGGVMCCSLVRNRLSAYGRFAQPAFSSDNAAGIALLAEKESRKREL